MVHKRHQKRSSTSRTRSFSDESVTGPAARIDWSTSSVERDLHVHAARFHSLCVRNHLRPFFGSSHVQYPLPVPNPTVVFSFTMPRTFEALWRVPGDSPAFLPSS